MLIYDDKCLVCNQFSKWRIYQIWSLYVWILQAHTKSNVSYIILTSRLILWYMTVFKLGFLVYNLIQKVNAEWQLTADMNIKLVPIHLIGKSVNNKLNRIQWLRGNIETCFKLFFVKSQSKQCQLRVFSPHRIMVRLLRCRYFLSRCYCIFAFLFSKKNCERRGLI